MNQTQRSRRQRRNSTVALLALVIVTGGSLAGTCTIDFGGGGGGGGGNSGYVPLDLTAAEIAIRPASLTQMGVEARITDNRGRTVTFRDGQAVAINGVGLVGPNEAGNYTTLVLPAAAYTVTVTEPTRGVQSTIVASPAAYTITSPTAGATVSLSGFLVSWSPAEPQAQVEVLITETIFGVQRAAQFGPGADAGSQTLSAADLAEFQQGAPLVVSVNKTLETSNLAGFADGVALVEAVATVSANPGP